MCAKISGLLWLAWFASVDVLTIVGFSLMAYYHSSPSSIYSWSIGHILEYEFFCLDPSGTQGSKEKKWI